MMLRRRRRRMATISLKSNDVRSKHGKQNKLLRWLNHSPSMAIGQPSLFVTVVTFTFWQLCSGEIFSIMFFPTRLERKWLPNCYLIECIEWCANQNGEAVKQAWHNDPTELQCTNPQMDFCHRKSIWTHIIYNAKSTEWKQTTLESSFPIGNAILSLTALEEKCFDSIAGWVWHLILIRWLGLMFYIEMVVGGFAFYIGCLSK